MTDGHKPKPPSVNRPKPQPLKRTPGQIAKQVQSELGAAQAEAAAVAQTEAQAAATRLAQVANLFLAGHSLSSIGAQIGATADEVDDMLNRDMARYVRNQPALRVFVRNYLSSKYTSLLDAVWDEATDKRAKDKLENQDRALRILKEMGRLHGADAPTQTEVKIEAAPEAIDAVVARLASGAGMGYDTSVFDTVPGEVVHSGPAAALAALERASADAERPQPEDEPLGLTQEEQK